jgi:RNA polymerase-binding protein DksA
MTEVEREGYRKRLTALKSRLSRSMSHLEQEALRGTGGETSGSLSNVPLHPADLGTDTYEEEMALGLLENEDRILTEINEALVQLEQGKFGRCENCGQAIPRERLEAVPYARYCITCAQKLQGPPVKQ